MNKFLIIVLFLITYFEAFAAEKMHISFQSSQIKQGSIVEARIIFNAEVVQRLDLSKLRNATLSDYFYVYEAELPLRKMGEESVGSDAKIIVLKIPASQPVVHTIGNEQIEITWNNIEFVPTEPGKGFIFVDFDVQAQKNLALIIWLSLALLLALLGGWRLFQKFKNKRIEKRRKEELRKKIESADSYDGVVVIWKDKTNFIKEFPHLETHFKNLELVLFRYQFKSSQTESEKKLVMDAYNDFLKQIKGGFNGI